VPGQKSADGNILAPRASPLMTIPVRATDAGGGASRRDAFCHARHRVLRTPLSRKRNFRITLRAPRALRYPADATVEVALITDPPGEREEEEEAEVHRAAACASVLCMRGETL